MKEEIKRKERQHENKKSCEKNQCQLLYFVSSGGGGEEEHKYKGREEEK